MAARYQSYDKYKVLDFPFLDKIPDSWKAVPLNVLSDFRQGKLHEPYIHEDGKFICVNSRFVSTEGKKVKFCSKNLSPVRKSDILMVMSDLPNGRALAKAFWVEGENNFALNQRVCAITPQKVDSRFLYYQLDRNPYFLAFDDGSNQTNLSNDVFKKYPVLLPSANEQQKIANFLDHETAKIDTLIEKQQQLITLLKEKRQAVISHAVTKGLNPNAPMRDSGVEWLGEVPEHWVVCRLKQTIKSGSSISYGIVQPGEPLEEGVAFVQTTNMSKGTFDLVDLQKTTKEIAKAYPRSELVGGEVILGIRASIGAAFVVPESLRGCNLSRGVARIIPSKHISSEYLVAYFGTGAVDRYWGLSKQGSTFSEVSIETVKEISFPVPPFEEQKHIAKWIDEKITRLDGVFQKAMEQTTLLNERRTALISAAVTGEIDVRNWVAPQASNNKEVNP
jgi:type I restriction enzyme S subunit